MPHELFLQVSIQAPVLLQLATGATGSTGSTGSTGTGQGEVVLVAHPAEVHYVTVQTLVLAHEG